MHGTQIRHLLGLYKQSSGVMHLSLIWASTIQGSHEIEAMVVGVPPCHQHWNILTGAKMTLISCVQYCL